MRIPQQFTLIDSVPEQTETLPVEAGGFRMGFFQLTQGRQAGCQLIVADSGAARIAVCPTRGMSIWKARLDGVDCQWNSPVGGPVHPQWVAIEEPSGLGWLDGFDELLVRCGLRSFGAPDFDASGKLLFPLHGRIGNLPAENVQVNLDEKQSVLTITGQVVEARFLMFRLRLSVEYRLELGQPIIAVRDRVTNESQLPTTMQLLYHINFGGPVLEEGAKLHLAARTIAARDARAAEDLDSWSTYRGPTSGYTEQVYFSQPIADAEGYAHALLVNSRAEAGVALRYRAETLPYFTQWKHTAADADGYVTGLEPGTGLPNPRSVEESRGRLIQLQPLESREFELFIEGSRNPARIKEIAQQITALQGAASPELLRSHTDWCCS
jgi:hypothetical protein